MARPIRAMTPRWTGATCRRQMGATNSTRARDRAENKGGGEEEEQS